MKRLLIEPLIWLVLGAGLAFGMDYHGVHILDDHPNTNWFLVGLGLLILGGFRCSPSDTGRSFANTVTSTSRQRLGGVQEEATLGKGASRRTPHDGQRRHPSRRGGPVSVETPDLVPAHSSAGPVIVGAL